MLFIQVFLPRFLVLEGLAFLYFLDHSLACNRKHADRFGEAVGKVVDALSCPNGTSNGDVGSDEPRGGIAIGPPSPGSSPSSSCGINLDDFPSKNLPLFLDSASGELLLPVKSTSKGDRWLPFPAEGAWAECPSARLKATGQKASAVACLGDGSSFEVDSGQSVSFGQLLCSRSIREKVRHTEETCGPSGGGGRVSEVGWEVEAAGGKRFLTQLSICHDGGPAATHFVRHVIRGAHIAALNDDPGRPSFKEGAGFYKSTSAGDAYKTSKQQTTLSGLIGSARTSQVFSRTKSFLAKGHLAPDADFVWKEWQDATYYFANAAPQWQPFNNGNWKAIEAEVRHYAEHAGRDIEVFTGTLGQLTYQSESGSSKVPLFIAKESGRSDPTLIPVPEFYWKVVHDPDVGGAVVFVGLNDPHFEGDPAVEAQICPDVCEQGMWFFFRRKEVSKGYSYCCAYQEFKAVVDWAPELPGDPELLDNILTVD